MEEANRTSSEKSALRYFAGYLKPFKRHFIAAVLFSGTGALLNLVPAQVIRYILNEAIPNRNIRFCAYAAGILAATFLLRSLILRFRTKLVTRMAQGIAANLRRDVFFHMQRLSLSFFDNARVGKLLSRVTNDSVFIQQFFTSGSHILVATGLTFAGVISISLHMNWQLTLIAIIPMPILMALIRKYSRIAHKIYRNLRTQWGNFTARINDNLGGIKEIKSFAREEYEEDRFNDENEQAYSLGIDAGDLDALYDPLIEFIGYLGMVLVVGLGSWLILNGNMQLGDLVAFLLYLDLLYDPLWRVSRLVNIWEHARAASDNISRVMSVPTEVYEFPQAIGATTSLKGAVEFKDVSFSYREKELILEDLSFKVNTGERIAVVGVTGSGKTTMLSLIPRFYDVDKGTITIDGRDIRDYKLSYLRGNIGIVQQDPFLFAGTIKENILYGKPDASEEEMEKAVEAANLNAFIQSLPKGYDTEVGERGVKISGGEKQRLAIARVLIKNPPILILDEATSSLDSRTEILVQQALERLMEGRTTFVIAHRLSTIKNTNRILVMSHARVVEEGRHEELMDKDGLYAHLYKLQFELGDQAGLLTSIEW